MANPRNVRKFSEKIALHNQKQAEETAEFEKIMREVQGVTVKESSIADERTIQKSRSTEILKRMPPSTSREYRCTGRQTGGPIRHKRQQEYSTSPYHQMSYLPLPAENNWRRSSSDSAIHQTVNHITLQEEINVEEANIGSNVINNRKTTNAEKYPQTQNQSHAVNNMDMRPRSSSQITNCNFEQTSGTRLDAPTMVNTGSLPDLSSVHLFFQPLNTASPSANNYYYYSGWDKSGLESIQPVRADEVEQMNSLKTEVLDFQTLQMLNNTEEFSQNICGETKEKELLNEYRIPPVRPSPGSSPNLQGNLVNHFEFDHSAPCSPVTHIKNNFQTVPDETEGYFDNSQKEMEQFSLDGLSAQLLDCMSTSGLDGSTAISNNSRNTYHENEGNRSIFNTNVLSPNIPEIVFTDYSSSNDGIAKEMLGDTFELGQMDIVGLQMLSDPDIVTDSFTEDSLRRDLNLN